MDKTGRKQKISLVYSFVLIAVLLAVIIYCAYLYVRELNGSMTSQTQSYLSEVSNQSSVVMRRQLLSDLQSLESMATVIGTYGNLNDIPQLLKVLQQEKDQHETLKRMGFILPDGKSYFSDGYVFNSKDREYFLLALKGTSNTSQVLIDKTDQAPIIVQATPVIRDKKTIGVLFSTHDIDAYQKLLSISSFDGDGYSYIVRNNGSVIIPSNKSSNKQGDSIFSQLQSAHFYQADSFEEMKNAMLAGKSGQIEYRLAGVHKYLNYTPIGVNDWYMLSVVPTQRIMSKAHRITRLSLAISISMVCLFAFLLFYITYTQNKHRKILEKAAYIDSVTEGRTFAKFLIDAKKYIGPGLGGKYAVISLDIDKFKVINDLYGYEQGNRTLRYISEQIETWLQPGELSCRVSGDVFNILIEDQSQSQLSARIGKLKQAISSNLIGNYSSVDFIFTVTCGVYRISDDTLSLSAVLERANLARTSAKHRRADTVAFFDEELRNQMLRDKEIENEMTAALERNEFEVYYQPKYHLLTGKAMGAEALVRWQHPSRGLLPPAEFIPVFERDGFVLQLDAYVLEQVCKQLRRWIDAGLDPLPIAVNQSRLHLHDPDFVSSYRAMVERYHLPPRLIELEITESALFETVDTMLGTMKQLHAAGFCLSMDDFGAGYSSLNLLRELPFDVLKLDRAFLDHRGDEKRGRKIIAGFVTIAKSLGIRLVAEGVETEEQAAFLREIGCDLAQGYLYAKPMPVEAFELELRKNGLQN